MLLILVLMNCGGAVLKRVVTVFSLLLVAAVGHAQEMPFSSQPTVPDYLVTMVIPPYQWPVMNS